MHMRVHLLRTVSVQCEDIIPSDLAQISRCVSATLGFSRVQEVHHVDVNVSLLCTVHLVVYASEDSSRLLHVADEHAAHLAHAHDFLAVVLRLAVQPGVLLHYDRQPTGVSAIDHLGVVPQHIRHRLSSAFRYLALHPLVVRFQEDYIDC